MDKHTPGPWDIEHVVYGSPGATANAVYVSAGGSWLCQVFNAHQPVGKADARLLAAAPELLEALRGLCAAREGDAGFRAAYEAAQSAIARATGEEK